MGGDMRKVLTFFGLAASSLAGCTPQTANQPIDMMTLTGPRLFKATNSTTTLEGWVVEYQTTDGQGVAGTSETPTSAVQTMTLGGSNGTSLTNVTFTSQDLIINIDGPGGDVIVTNASPTEIANALQFAQDEGRDFLRRDVSIWDYTAIGFYGAELVSDYSTQTTGAIGAVGWPTDPSDFPTSGTANFVGIISGLGHVGVDATPITVTGDLLLESDFVSVDVTASNSQYAVVGPGGVPATAFQSANVLDFTGTGSLSSGGTFFIVNASGPGAGSTGMSGQLYGSFFGPNAEEVGGSFQMLGPETEYFGAFIGAR